ncbi:hypothetical protein GBA52_028658 [Prunus armeniaca]|nr:hypothetical protein GBA52_028658 [Prunus armeniaca]
MSAKLPSLAWRGRHWTQVALALRRGSDSVSGSANDSEKSKSELKRSSVGIKIVKRPCEEDELLLNIAEMAAAKDKTARRWSSFKNEKSQLVESRERERERVGTNQS